MRGARHGLSQETWPFTRRAASAPKTWFAAAGSIASCATSAPGSRPVSPASSGPTAWRAAPGAGSTTSRPMSGPRWWPTTSLSSFACDQAEASPAAQRSGKRAIASPSSCPRLRRQALSGADCTFDRAKFRKYIHNPDTNIAPNSQTEGKTTRLWTETSLSLVENAKEKARRGLRGLKGFLSGLKITINDVDFGLSIDPEHCLVDSGNIESDLPDLIVAVAEVAKAANRP